MASLRYNATVNSEKQYLSGWSAYAWTVPILILDQLTKWWVVQEMPLWSRITFDAVDPYFRLTHVANTGAAFGFMQDSRWIFTVLALIVSAMLIWFNHSMLTESRLPRTALGLILGGAIGNLIDRIRIGHVTDFLDFDVSSLIDIPYADWPVFNVADMAVVTGAIMLAYISFFKPNMIEEGENSVTVKEDDS